MRALAAKLGVEAMSLYNHVPSKDDVLNGIVDRVVGEIDVPADTSDWRASMRRRAISVHGVLLRHPWAASLIESRSTLSPIRLRYAESVLGVLRGAGFSIDLAYATFLTLDSYVYGFTLQEVSWPYPAEQVQTVVERLQPLIPASEYPNVNEVMRVVSQRRAQSARGYEPEFLFGLDLTLDALEGALRAERGT